MLLGFRQPAYPDFECIAEYTTKPVKKQTF